MYNNSRKRCPIDRSKHGRGLAYINTSLVQNQVISLRKTFTLTIPYLVREYTVERNLKPICFVWKDRRFATNQFCFCKVTWSIVHATTWQRVQSSSNGINYRPSGFFHNTKDEIIKSDVSRSKANILALHLRKNKAPLAIFLFTATMVTAYRI